MDLNTVWFLLVGVLIIGYAILDGFDLGVGVIQLFTKDENEKRINLNAVGPVWDGNEVWLLTGGGALFAAFPIVYATVFSGFYLAFMLLLLALIARAVSFELRNKFDAPGWKKLWDYAFGIGSLLPAILFGVAIGNILRGIPLNGSGEYLGSFLGLLNPYSIVVGLVSLSMFIMHGAIYMAMKSEDDQRERMINWANRSWVVFLILYVLATFFTFFEGSYLFQGLLSNVLFWILLIVLLLSIVFIPVSLKSEKFGRAFFFSSLMIAAMIGLAALSLFPRLVPSSIDLVYSLTIYNASSTPRTLLTMFIIALIGMPIVIGYSIYVYRVFKGKVVITKESY